MMSNLTLGEKQELFMRLLPRLIDKAHELGYELRGGELWRSPEAARINADKGIGTMNSLHTQKLAIDLNLFYKGMFMTESSAHKELGTYWKSLHRLCRWGGDFLDSKGRPKPDGNHYSIEHEGRK